MKWLMAYVLLAVTSSTIALEYRMQDTEFRLNNIGDQTEYCWVEDDAFYLRKGERSKWFENDGSEWGCYHHG